MIFDKLCRLAERGNFEHMKALCKRAALFHLNMNLDDSMGSYEDGLDAVRAITEDFHLPFPVVCVEDDERCTFLFRNVCNEDDSCALRGITDEVVLKFLSWNVWSSDVILKHGGTLPIDPRESWYAEGYGGQIAGIFYASVEGSEKIMLRGDVPFLASGGERSKLEFRKIADMDDYELSLFSASGTTPRECGLTGAAYAIEKMRRAMLPTNWIFKKINEKARPVKKRSVPRSDQRTRYIIVSNKEVNRVIRIPNPNNERNPITPHRRRGHWKRLTSARYRWKRGQVVWTKPTWVGPKAFTRNGERYEVCLEI